MRGFHPALSEPETQPGLVGRLEKQAREARGLSPVALKSASSRGRAVDEPEDPLRTCFERDRDRIVHATAFRRLMYKTQVFVNREGDQYRTRLSHSLEVAQVTRSVGNALGLNEPLCEALGLAHDIGHPPFGHRGEVALNELMKDHGGFRHNAQVLRVTDLLERRSPNYRGLNLTLEVRESLLKHEMEWPAELGPRTRRPYLEAQVADLADSTAYHAHDVEDGLNAGMFTEDDLDRGSRLWCQARASVDERYPGFLSDSDDRKLRIRTIANQMMKLAINDLIHSSRERIDASGVSTPEEVRAHETPLVVHGKLAGDVKELRGFLYKHFYRHDYLMRFSEHAREVLTTLFPFYVEHPEDMPRWYRAWADEVGLERAVCDYLAGMTDRFAEREYDRLRA